MFTSESQPKLGIFSSMAPNLYTSGAFGNALLSSNNLRFQSILNQSNHLESSDEDRASVQAEVNPEAATHFYPFSSIGSSKAMPPIAHIKS